jgi:hypothetical protein
MVKAFKGQKPKLPSQVLIANIKEQHEAVLQAFHQGYQHAITCGEHLIRAKEQVKAWGQQSWKDWFGENCPWLFPH